MEKEERIRSLLFIIDDELQRFSYQEIEEREKASKIIRRLFEVYEILQRI